MILIRQDGLSVLLFVYITAEAIEKNIINVLNKICSKVNIKYLLT